MKTEPISVCNSKSCMSSVKIRFQQGLLTLSNLVHTISDRRNKMGGGGVCAPPSFAHTLAVNLRYGPLHYRILQRSAKSISCLHQPGLHGFIRSIRGGDRSPVGGRIRSSVGSAFTKPFRPRTTLSQRFERQRGLQENMRK